MSLESLSNEVFGLMDGYSEKFPGLPLIQGDKLQAASEIDIHRSDFIEQAYRMFMLGRAMAESRKGLVAVAYTEMEQDVLDYFGIDRNSTNAIYISQQQTDEDKVPYCRAKSGFQYLGGYLLINPKIEPVGGRKHVKIGACGSINYGKVYMLNLWPEHARTSAYIFNPIDNVTEPTYAHYIYGEPEAAATLLHEFQHILGFDAANAPGHILMNPFVNSRIWKGHKREDWLDYMEGLTTNDGQPVVYLIRRDGKLIVVDENGSKLRDFSY